MILIKLFASFTWLKSMQNDQELHMLIKRPVLIDEKTLAQYKKADPYQKPQQCPKCKCFVLRDSSVVDNKVQCPNQSCKAYFCWLCLEIAKRKKSLLTILASSTFYSAQIYNLKTLERRGICAAKDLPSSQKCLGFKFTSWVKVLFGDELKETMRKLERAVLSILLLGGST